MSNYQYQHPEVQNIPVGEPIGYNVTPVYPVQPKASPTVGQAFGAKFAGFALALMAFSFVGVYFIGTSADRAQIEQAKTEMVQAQQRAEAAESELLRVQQCVLGGGQQQ